MPMNCAQMMGGGGGMMMVGAGLVWLLVVAALLLAIAALVKYLRTGPKYAGGRPRLWPSRPNPNCSTTKVGDKGAFDPVLKNRASEVTAIRKQ